MDGLLSHADLYAMRGRLAPNDPRQRHLALLEHEAFAREWTQENPFIAAPSLLFAIPAYTAAKKAGLLNARTPGSLEEIMAGYRGLLGGLSTGMGF